MQEGTFSDADMAWHDLLRSLQPYSVGLPHGGGRHGKTFMMNMQDLSTKEQKMV